MPAGGGLINMVTFILALPLTFFGFESSLSLALNCRRPPLSELPEVLWSDLHVTSALVIFDDGLDMLILGGPNLGPYLPARLMPASLSNLVPRRRSPSE